MLVAGWQYLQYPEKLSFEILRVIRPQGKFIISFSNRAFWNKSPRIWIESSDNQRIKYVTDVLKAQGWSIDRIINEPSKTSFLKKILNVTPDPFFCVIATNAN